MKMYPRPCWGLLALLAACDGGSDGGSSGEADASADAGVLADAGAMTPDGGAPLAQGAVSGELTYVQVDEAGLGHLYSARADGGGVQQITGEAGRYGAHAVSPDRLQVALTRREGDDPEGREVLWILDLQTRDAQAISPEGCDVRGVGWRDERRVIFGLRCDDGTAGVWISSDDNTGRDLALMLPLTETDVEVDDVSTAVGSPLFAFSRQESICAGDACEARWTLWAGNESLGAACRVSDGSPERAGPWLGDRSPSFTADLRALVFSRHVPEKDTDQPHYDTFRVDVDQRAVFDGDDFCGLPGTLTTLTDALFSDEAPGGDSRLSELTPQPLTDLGGAGALYLFIGQWGAGPMSGLFLVDVAGMAGLLTGDGHVTHGRWLVTEYDTSGER